MENDMLSAYHLASTTYWGIPGFCIAWLLFLTAVGLFGMLIWRRYLLIRAGQPDPRFHDIPKRVKDLIVYGLVQKRQPRYLVSGAIHLMIFWGFVVLSIRTIDLVTQGLQLPVMVPLLSSGFGTLYEIAKDLFELLVLVACVGAAFYRAIRRPDRYQGSHSMDAYLILSMISALMVTDILFEGSVYLADGAGPSPAWLPAAGLAGALLSGMETSSLLTLQGVTYWVHLVILYVFLNLLPLGKHFHVITALPNVFLKKTQKGSLKPARWGVEDFETLESLGAEKLEDLTWKHLLDLVTCTECGRCSDNCPAHAVGRPLSPKMLTLHLRAHAYDRYPVLPSDKNSSEGKEPPKMVGDIVTPDELWSCTTCGACEEECPVFIEYIDKIVDMRRHLIESAQNPNTFNPVLMSLERNFNPLGKPNVKRADWLNEVGEIPPVKRLKAGDTVDVLYFVDSFPSFDPGFQPIAGSLVRGLAAAGVDFGILGPLEKDSGHQVRRMGEEGLFQLLMEENMETLEQINFNRIVTTDPHAFNTLKNDYPGTLKVVHYSEFFWELLQAGHLKPIKAVASGDVYTYHDPCYLGRHNGIYDSPRGILSVIPGITSVDMARCRDRSFCCGGADITLWHEIPNEKRRMASMRVEMAMAAGATVLVTACPFCQLHFEDAIKTDGLEDRIRVVDLMTLLVSTLS